MRTRQHSRLLLLIIMLLGLPLACDRSGNGLPRRDARLDFDTILPEDWKHVGTCPLDTNDDGEEEWVVLYRFDVPTEEKQSSPIAVAVYQPDSNRPPNIIAHELRAQGSDYLCECDCMPTMEDVLSGLEGPELVVRDRCSEQTTRLTIFHWDAGQATYLPEGHFCGSCITATLNQVRLEERLPVRAQLSTCETFRPRDNRTYYQSDDRSTQLTCVKKEFVFSCGEPEDVTCSPYPEKVVLAFYCHYNEDEQAPTFFAEGQWAQLGQCNTGRCGCFSPRSEITHVRVTYLEPETYSEAGGTGPDRATVNVMVICERRNDAPEGERYIRWHLVREGDHWYLDHPD